MTTEETKSDGPAVLSSVELEGVDKFNHPDHGWMWRECEVRWIDARVAAAVLAERERAALVCDEKARIRADASDKHIKNSPARDMCLAAALAALNCAASIRGGEVVRSNVKVTWSPPCKS